MIVWLFTLVMHLSLDEPLPSQTLFFSLLLAFACFSITRFVFRVYYQILRSGSVTIYAREFMADILAAGIYFAATRLIDALQIPLTSVVTFTGVYIAGCLSFRVAYYYLYQLAQLDNPACRILKQIMIHFTLVDFDASEQGGLMRLVLQLDLATTSPINEIQHVIDQFAIRGEMTNIIQIKRGYINRTYRVETLSEENDVYLYTLQRINTNIFQDVDALMENFKLTTDHLHGRFFLPGRDRKGSVPVVQVTKEGRSYLKDDSGCWRMLSHFDGVYSLDIPDSPQTFYHAGRAFGKFMKEMSDINPDDLRIIIPNFHNTRSRYQDLEQEIGKDPKGRVKNVEREIEFVRARAGCFGIIADALETGAIPTRICHNDCNLNNILFDNHTHLPVAVIDLDTVMPSSPLYDYGDSMRVGTNTATDDEKDLSKVSCNLKLYEQYARGYLEECGSMLTRRELELLPYASLIITAEDGIRFLMDHIDGDIYYSIYYPGQNLDRARAQLKLLEDMERKLPDIIGILKTIYADLKLDVALDKKTTLERWKVEER